VFGTDAVELLNRASHVTPRQVALASLDLYVQMPVVEHDLDILVAFNSQQLRLGLPQTQQAPGRV
jgi:hypothetical protein